MSSVETRYSQFEKEAVAERWALQLYGLDFEIFTDQKSPRHCLERQECDTHWKKATVSLCSYAHSDWTRDYVCSCLYSWRCPTNVFLTCLRFVLYHFTDTEHFCIWIIEFYIKQRDNIGYWKWRLYHTCKDRVHPSCWIRQIDHTVFDESVWHISSRIESLVFGNCAVCCCCYIYHLSSCWRVSDRSNYILIKVWIVLSCITQVMRVKITYFHRNRWLYKTSIKRDESGSLHSVVALFPKT